MLRLGGLLYVIRGHLGNSFEVELWSDRIGWRSLRMRCMECAPGKLVVSNAGELCSLVRGCCEV